MKETLIITGASAGIGKATAALFLEKDWKVINLSRRTCPVEGAISLAVDLSKENFLKEIRAQLERELAAARRICLVHNAAVLQKDSFETLAGADFRNVLQINLIAPQILNAFLFPFMKPASSVLYVGSTLSEKAVKGAFSYVTTKHAQMGMMKATCQDLAGTGIHTAGICPGFTDTEMLNAHLNNDPEIIDAIKSMNAFNRLVDPREIAETLYFAATHPALNGAVIHANLGQIER